MKIELLDSANAWEQDHDDLDGIWEYWKCEEILQIRWTKVCLYFWKKFGALQKNSRICRFVYAAILGTVALWRKKFD